MLIDPMLERMGGAEAAPKFAMVRHTLRLPGMADVSADVYCAQLRHMLDAALTYERT
ncbi:MULTISPECIES: hypothetical protein [Rhodobacterales]|uniref:hypothetical protein n=1 Tax=Rhodobacterales TaxID=204455 RepID=UPI0015F03016|nr:MULTISPECIES: hypothetical protein [Rhodobacterales]MDO6589331.1 hypothetical protein [Yoonia sp. 1_MG-2023]